MRIILFIVSFFIASTAFASNESQMMQSVIKIKVYEKDIMSWNYSFTHWGSAVVLDNKNIITNAHVILDKNNEKPTGYYEVCRAQPDKKDPVCFTTAKLLTYDTITDLATLEVSGAIPGAQKMVLSDKKIDIWSSMIVYGYPSIGGSNITRTEGKIGWMEWEKYKFDGTIDHGNSGGGAFDTNGKLVGMPYAVSSDNGVIGYIISSATISKFLSWKSYNKEKYTSPKLTEFIKYTKEIESAYKNINSIKTKYVDIKDMGKAGFLLQSVVASIDGRIFDYRFIDKNERVAVLIGCSKDSSWGKSMIQINEWELDNKDNSPLVSIKWGYLDAEKKYFSMDAMQLKETNGEKVVYTSIVHASASNCAITIIANDGLKKDKALYQKAIELAKNVKFLSPTPLATSYNSPFFSAQAIPKNVYIAEGTVIDNSVILPNIHFELWKDYSTADSIEIGTYANRDEYMNMFAEEGGYYKSSDYSFDAFYNRYKTPNDSRIIEEVVIKSKNNKKMILTVLNLAQWNNDQNIQKTRVLMFYPFQDTLGKYRSYTLRFDFASQDRTYIQEIRSFLEAMELPGNAAFTN